MTLSPHAEICIDVKQKGAVAAAFRAGAERVELCTELAQDGLSLKPEQISAARRAFGERSGLVVMVRPRAGNFVYDEKEVREMISLIHRAKQRGADSVVFGALQENGQIDLEVTKRLLEVAGYLELDVAIHRAFDATPDRSVAAEVLHRIGVKRILTSCTPWVGGGPLTEGLDEAQRLLNSAPSELEFVFAGSVGPDMLEQVWSRLNVGSRQVSFHAHSGAKNSFGKITRESATRFVSAVHALV